MIKKLVFALPFIFSLLIFTWQLNLVFNDIGHLFALNGNLIWQLIWLAILAALTCYFFILFASFALDYKIVLPVIILGSLFTIILISFPFNIIFTAGLILAFILSFALQFNKITKDPSSFSVNSHILKSAGQLSTFILLAASLSLYFLISVNNQKIAGELTSSLVDISLNFSKIQQNQNPDSLSNLALTSDQISLLKQNPEVLKQYGLDPTVLDQLDQGKLSQDNPIDLAKPLIQKQVTDIIQPYLPYFPIFITFIFFLNIQFLSSILSFFLSPVFYLIFWLLEKTGFVKYSVETREVKKLVI